MNAHGEGLISTLSFTALVRAHPSFCGQAQGRPSLRISDCGFIYGFLIYVDDFQ